MKVPLSKSYWDKNDIDAVNKIIMSGYGWADGKEIEIFEKQFAKYVGTKYAVMCNSGTSALHAALLTLQIGPGDEVIVPSFTFIATANAVLMVGAKPVFADIETETFGLDPNDVLAKITDRTKAIIPVHIGGTPCKIQELKAIADDYGLFLLEDACEGLGAKVGDKMVGSFGQMAVFSFCRNKVMTTGEGGAIVTNSQPCYNILKSIISHGRERYSFVRLGYNWRMPTILAALGISQLNKIDTLIKKRRDNAFYLAKKLSLQPEEKRDNFSVFQLFSILLMEKSNRDKIMKSLAKQGIETKVYFNPIHQSPFYRALGYKDELPITEYVSRHIITLPMYPSLTQGEMDYMADKFVSLWKKY